MRKNELLMNPTLKSIILTPFNILYSINPRLTLSIIFRIKQNYPLNLDNPRTYSEKLQWEKLYYKNPMIPKLVDKYTVREYVEARCPGILATLLWEGFNPERIPWESLPEKFVIKATHGSGFNIICTDKSSLDHSAVEKKLCQWLRAKFIPCYGEWFYGVERPRIIIEEFLDNGSGSVPEDYKVMCFSGEPRFIIVDTDRYSGHKRNIYDLDWNCRKNVTLGFPNDNPINPLPEPLTKELLNYARKLSDGFPHVRVDFYVVRGHIYFGEMTFTNGAGFDRIRPYEFDKEMGELLVLPEKTM